jgi:hypothetical protein
MRIVLRLIAVVAALSVIGTAMFILGFGMRGLQGVLASGLFGAITIAGWVTTFVAGSIAAVQLFRPRESGRIAALVLFGSMLLYYLVGLAAFREPYAPVLPIVIMCIPLAALVAVLLLPAAKRACRR